MNDNYFSNLKYRISKLLKNVGTKSNNILFVKYYGNFDIKSDFLKNVANDRIYHGYVYLYHSYCEEEMLSVYEPFLLWIKELMDGMNEEKIEEIFEICNVYKPHREIFLQYLMGKKIRRKELVLFDEIPYEQARMRKQIISIISYFSQQKPLVLVFNKIHVAEETTIELLNELFSFDRTENIAVIASFNESINILNHEENLWKELISYLGSNNMIYDWDIFEVENNTVVSKCLIIDNNKVKLYLDKINNMISFLSYNQAIFYLKKLYHKFEVEKADISNEERFEICYCYANACIQVKDYSTAFILADNLKKLANDNEKKYLYHLVMAQAYIVCEKYDSSILESEKSKSIAFTHHRDDLLVYAQIIQHVAKCSSWRGIWYYKNIDENEKFIIEECKKYGYKNILAHIYAYEFCNNEEFYRNIDTVKKSLVDFNYGIELGEELGNEKFLLEAYKKALLIASANGYIDVSNYFYLEKCLPIINDTKDIFEEANCYIGIGYNCTAKEQFEKANNYYNKALAIQYKIGNITYIGEILYNMTMNAMLAGDYINADNYITSCIKIIRNQKIDSKIRVCHISKICGLKALCSYRLGNIYNCKLYLNNSKRIIDFVLKSEKEEKTFYYWSDDLFLYYFVKGILARDSGEYAVAEMLLNKAEFYSLRGEGSSFFSYSQCIIEKIKLFNTIGENIKANKTAEECILYCKKNGYKVQEENVKEVLDIVNNPKKEENQQTDKHITNDKNLNKKNIQMVLKGIDVINIDELSKNIGIINRAKEERERIKFYSMWSNIVNDSLISPESTAYNSIDALKNNFGMDACIFIQKDDKDLKVIYNNAKIKILKRDIKNIKGFFKKNHEPFAISRLDSNFYEYKELISIFGLYNIASICAVPIIENEEISSIIIMYMYMRDTWFSKLNKYMFNDEWLGTFVPAFRQLLDALERQRIHSQLKDINNRLSRMALEDGLTGLYNRQGLKYKILNSDIFNNKQECGILYLDLDNFKYYNDHFGHEAGDLILISFANMLKEICGESGFAVRYGGDEFLAIISTDDRNQIINSAKNIFKTLIKKNAFTSEIENLLNRKIDIKQSNKVSCSIGISFIDNGMGEEAFEAALKKADDTLYYIKNSTKGRYELWDNIE